MSFGGSLSLSLSPLLSISHYDRLLWGVWTFPSSRGSGWMDLPHRTTLILQSTGTRTSWAANQRAVIKDTPTARETERLSDLLFLYIYINYWSDIPLTDHSDGLVNCKVTVFYSCLEWKEPSMINNIKAEILKHISSTRFTFSSDWLLILFV